MDVKIILCNPQMGENIGQVARAMDNFFLKELRIVNPRDGWPNEKALANSSNARDLILNAKIYSSLKNALADVDFSYAITARTRYLNKKHHFSNDISSIRGNSALVFGPENNGLSNEEISLNNEIITIPTNPENPSLNLAHAVSIICYQLTVRNNNMESKTEDVAKKNEIFSLFEHLEKELQCRGFFKILDKKPAMIQNIRSIFNRIENFTSQDVRTIRGIIKTLVRDKNEFH